jgi:hypothetical protein
LCYWIYSYIWWIKCDFTDAVISIKVDIAIAVKNNSIWMKYIRARGRAAVAAEAAAAGPRHRRDDAGARLHPPDAVIKTVGDENIATAVHRHSTWFVQSRIRGEAPVTSIATHASIASRTTSRHGRDDPRVRGHPPNAMIVIVGDEQISAAVHYYFARAS